MSQKRTYPSGAENRTKKMTERRTKKQDQNRLFMITYGMFCAAIPFNVPIYGKPRGEKDIHTQTVATTSAS